jgi:hypothetical protein
MVLASNGDRKTLVIFPLVHPSTNWISHQLSVTALDTQTTIKFAQAYGPWPFLDAVSVVAIPEPCSLTLAWFGFSLMVVLSEGRTTFGTRPHGDPA